jgi:hypothetical protein
MAEDLRASAEALGLEVVIDPLVTPGTYRLALAERGNLGRGRTGRTSRPAKSS